MALELESSQVAQLNALRAQIRQELQYKAGGASPAQWWKANPAALALGSKHPCEPKVVRVLKGHFGKVYSLYWAGDSRRLVSASQDGKLIIWNVQSGNKVQAIPLRSSWVMTCAFEQSANELVACGGLDNVCSIYNVSSEGGISATEAHRELSGHEGYLSCCRFVGPDQMVTSSGDSTCMQWDVATGAQLRHFKDHAGDVMSVAVNAQHAHVFASGSTDATAKVFDMRVGRSVLTFFGHESDINSVAFFPDGQAIGTGSDDASCKLFDLRACRELATYGTETVVCGVTCTAFSKSGRLLFAGYDDYNLYGWDVTCRDKPLQITSHENRVSCVQVTTDGSALCSGSWDQLLKVLA
jgi:guanine nucleotide-binding protein G(I)/G(S)/G(T) subunit beta-1